MNIESIYNHNCGLCPLYDVGNKTVCLSGRGDPESRGIIIGEAPGAQEDDRGVPFIGKSGKHLDIALSAAGVATDELFITNTVKCRPPGNRTPTESEISSCFVYLDEEVARINPVAMMTLGNVPMLPTLGRKSGVTKQAGLWKRITGPYEDILVMPNYHPAYVFRNPDKEGFFQEVVKDFVDVWRYGLTHTIEETWSYAKPA